MKHLALSTTVLAALLTAGCATTSENEQRADTLRQKYQTMVDQYQLEKYAPMALKDADEAIRAAEQLAESGADQDDIEHQVYLAERKLDIAREMVELKISEEFIANSDTERQNMLLDAKTMEVLQAKAAVAVLAAEADAANTRATVANTRATAANARAAAVEDEVDMLAERARQLQSEVQELATQNSERGIVFTLGDILFETGKAQLKSGGERALAKVASLLQEYPEQKITVEGFTDNEGTTQANKQLSEQRAQAVKDALVSMGIPSERVNTRGFGEQYPVASNDNAAGRLQNRRVEIIVGEDTGAGVAGRE